MYKQIVTAARAYLADIADMDELEGGRGKALVRDHVVIAGWSSKLKTVLSEFGKADALGRSVRHARPSRPFRSINPVNTALPLFEQPRTDHLRCIDLRSAPPHGRRCRQGASARARHAELFVVLTDHPR